MEPRLLWGMMEMLILEVLTHGPSYGYQIAQTVRAQSGGTFDLKEGSLYPALHRLERQKLLSAYWVDTDEGRRRKFYKLTPAGQEALKDRRDEWNRLAEGINGVLGQGPAGVTIG